MNIRLICMDLDGTALQNDHKTFTPRLQAALEACRQQGVTVVPVTGRQFGLLPPPLKEIPRWAELAVLCNGGQIRKMRTGEVLYARNIDRDALEQLLDLSEELDIPIEFSLNSTLYLTEHSLQMQKPVENLNFHVNTILKENGRIVPELTFLSHQPIEKVNLPYIPPHLKEKVLTRLRLIRVSAVWASATSMEITNPHATKGEALEALCRMLNIPIEQTMALGDSGNDVTMLRKAGLGVAMGNAPETVKTAADVITESNDRDGAAIAIERYVLK